MNLSLCYYAHMSRTIHAGYLSHSCIVDNLATVKDEYPRHKVTRGSWHLDMENPMPCSGFVSEIKLHYFKVDNSSLNFCVSVAMFEATSNNHYFQVSCTLLYWCAT